MSRSYKKTPWCGEQKNKADKRNANKKVRMFLKNPNNHLLKSDYKKIFESWEICDYGWVISWNEYWNNCLSSYNEHPEWYKEPPNKKVEYRKWYKYYKMK